MAPPARSPRVLVVSESCWLQDDPAAEVQDFFAVEGDEVGDVAARRTTIADAGHTLITDFVLPAVGRWENYCVPLAERLKSFRAAHSTDPEALEVAARSEREIELHRRYSDVFGYVFFVMTPDDRGAR